MARWEPTRIPMDDNYSIEITTNPRQITEGVDPRWVGRDRAGHAHRGSDLTATLTAVSEDCYCSLVDEPHTVFVRWECSVCGEEVTPRNLSEWNSYTVLDPTARVSTPDGNEWDVYDVASLRERIAIGQEINVAFLDTVGTRTGWSADAWAETLTPTVDYRALLTRYMRIVHESEGRVDLFGNDPEIVALRAIAADVLGEDE